MRDLESLLDSKYREIYFSDLGEEYDKHDRKL